MGDQQHGADEQDAIMVTSGSAQRDRRDDPSVSRARSRTANE
jgi:hypothetical protein